MIGPTDSNLENKTGRKNAILEIEKIKMMVYSFSLGFVLNNKCLFIYILSRKKLCFAKLKCDTLNSNNRTFIVLLWNHAHTQEFLWVGCEARGQAKEQLNSESSFGFSMILYKKNRCKSRGKFVSRVPVYRPTGIDFYTLW